MTTVFRRLASRLRPGGAFAEGQAALDRGEFDVAIEAFELHLRNDPANSNAWYNLGLAHKFRRDWQASMIANKRAAEIDPSNEPAFWNCGVAATAIRDWRTARWAWRGIGIDMGDGDDAPDQDGGPSPVRISPDGEAEVVWGRRIDPCRIRIDSVPLPDSGHVWHDVVLHDVVPNGERVAMGRAFAVFDELLRMDPSDEPMWQTDLSVPTEEDEVAVQERLMAAELGIDDWSMMRMLCAQCSTSTVHAHASPDDSTPIRLSARRHGVAGPREQLERELAAWASEAPGRAFGGLEAISQPARD